MKLHNKKHERYIKVYMPSGQGVRITLIEGEFELSQLHVDAMMKTPVGAAYIKEMTPKKPRKPKDVDQSEVNDKAEPTV